MESCSPTDCADPPSPRGIISHVVHDLSLGLETLLLQAVVKEYIPQGQFCKLAPGTLHLVRVAEQPQAVWSAAKDLNEGDEVWVSPVDSSCLTQVMYGIRVGGRHE